MFVSFTAPTGLPSGETTNVLWPWKAGANNLITNYTATVHVYFPTITNITAFEYDTFGFHDAGSTGNRYMFGSECDNPSLTAGKLRIWNAQATSWVTTGVSCSIFGTAGVWHSLVWTLSADPITSTACNDNPCMHYLTLTIDGTLQSGFPLTEPSGTSSDPNNNGTQIQLDGSNAGGTVSAYVDEMSLVMSTTSGAAATPVNSPLAGTYVGSQSVTMTTASSGAVICYNTTGSPVTNGTTGCTTGTLYTGAVTVSSSETLYAVAGGTGYTDSTVNTSAYVISPPATNPGIVIKNGMVFQ
jgi:hypothetical protein